MMRFLAYLPILLLCKTMLVAHEDLKATIANYQQLLQNCSPEQCLEYSKELAIAYYKDQDHERAFNVYLKGIESVQPDLTHSSTHEEEEIYDKAMDIYLDYSDASTQEKAKDLLNNFLGTINEHPEYYHLGFIIATAQANLDQFPAFFERFSQSYMHASTHYFAYKTKAMLHTKLFLKGRTPQERELQRNAILQNLQNALRKCPADTALYPLILSFTPEEERSDAIVRVINQVVDYNVVLSKAEILKYVEEAETYSQVEAAQKLLNKAHEWYPNSRFLKDRG